MLIKLSIKNYTLIESMEIGFEKGFTAITGETGAGKSILLGALSLILGKRADPSVLMDKSRKCVVEGEFDLSKLELENFFGDNDLDYERQCLLRREILPSGKSRAFINDTPVNLVVLKELGEQLVDIHSQHQTLLLNEALFQLELYDGYVNEAPLLKEYQLNYKAYRQSETQLEQYKADNAQAKRDEDYFRFQLNELEAARLNVDEMDELEEKFRMLSHAEEINLATAKAVQALKEDENCVIDQLNRTKESFSKLTEFHRNIKEFYERISTSVIELSDLANEIEGFSGGEGFDPAELVNVEERLDVLYRLQQKHHATDMSDLIRITEDYREKLDAIQMLDDQVNKEQLRLNSLTKSLEKKAEVLSIERKSHITEFERATEKLLHLLGMKDALFKVQIDELAQYGTNGKDDLHFLFTANKGSQLSDIARSASGGELSRLMLALKSLVHQVKVLPTIIFDEIDAGVSGEIAGKLGNILKEMSQQFQVMSITHLPQIAAKADTQLKVFKSLNHGMTNSEIIRLDQKGRLEEIAKMLSDEKITDAARQAALELMQK